MDVNVAKECKRSGQIPAFGNWDYANDLPITQYFESARQAGLLRYSSSSGECDLYGASTGHYVDSDIKKPPLSSVFPPRKTRGRERERERRNPQVKEQKKQGKVCDVTEPPSKRPTPQKLPHVRAHTRTAHPKAKPPPPPPSAAAKPPKAVDEDLYKIPPELLGTSKRKKMLGIISRCLVPSCSV
ncbi:formin-like protein 2 isoform X2 [Malania oleifera]|uniref:formin-like protein 2 isoform X2 n=1 Tax=Malania oleifera TaxID=397392 RepID=UPI0025AE61CC|nr:formin-like protein 2 isoform X2 [Malania oleifera]